MPGSCGQVDIVFVVDSSGSIKPENWPRVRTFMRNVVGQFDVGRYAARFGTAVFGNDVQPVFQLKTHGSRADVVRAIEQMRRVAPRIPDLQSPQIDRERNSFLRTQAPTEKLSLQLIFLVSHC